jgi:hypothetical protein
MSNIFNYEKHTLIIIILINLNTLAQDQRLYDETWCLRNFIINNSDNFPPTSTRLNFTDDTPNDIILGICDDFNSNSVCFDISNSTFTVLENSWTSGAGGCFNPTDTAYLFLYYAFYEDNDATAYL